MTTTITQRIVQRLRALDAQGRLTRNGYRQLHELEHKVEHAGLDSPRYCYTCQVWCENECAAVLHNGHSIH